jgi:hypothetical protein
VFAPNQEPLCFLHHYTTDRALLGEILPHRALRFSPLAWTNDPRENREWLVSLAIDPAVTLRQGEFIDIVRQAAERIRATTKVLCLTRDDPDFRYMHTGKGYGHSPMWAHYAGAHRGVCLIFDWPALADTLSAQLGGRGSWWSGEVEYDDMSFAAGRASELRYSDIQSSGLGAVVDAHIDQHIQGLFFTKVRDWSHEWEYRWILRDGSLAPAFVDVTGALVGIVLGERFPDPSIPLLRELVEPFDHDIQLARCVWRNGLPTVVPLQV